MQPDTFDGANTTFAKDQPQYTPLPVRLLKDGTATSYWRVSNDVEASVLFKRLEEYLEGKGPPPGVYVTQLTFNRPLQPIMVTLNAPSAAFESLPVDEETTAKVQIPGRGNIGLEEIAKVRGLSAPFIFAMDNVNTPGKVVCHFIRFESIEFDNNAEAKDAELKTIDSRNDTRVNVLANSFQSSQNEHVVQILQVVVVLAQNLSLVMKESRLLSPQLVQAANNALATADALLQRYIKKP